MEPLSELLQDSTTAWIPSLAQKVNFSDFNSVYEDKHTVERIIQDNRVGYRDHDDRFSRKRYKYP